MPLNHGHKWRLKLFGWVQYNHKGPQVQDESRILRNDQKTNTVNCELRINMEESDQGLRNEGS